MPIELSNERKFGQDIRRLIKLVCKAILNPSKLAYIFHPILAYVLVYIPWNIEEYYLECIKGKNNPTRTKFPNPQLGAISEPATIVDSEGHIAIWFLPGLLSNQHQVRPFFSPLISSQFKSTNQSDVRTATVSIGPLLRESIKSATQTSTTANWRIRKHNFMEPNSQQFCEPGAINFSAGWFGQAHDVSS